jgi:hypothetical protein
MLERTPGIKKKILGNAHEVFRDPRVMYGGRFGAWMEINIHSSNEIF